MKERTIKIGSNGKYQIIEEEIVASGSMAELMSVLQHSVPTPMVILPHEEMGCAGYIAGKNIAGYLMYLSPKRRMVRYHREDDGRVLEYRVNLPHSYFLIVLQLNPSTMTWTSLWTSAFVSREKLRTPQDSVGPLPMPNVDKGARLCTGAMFFSDTRSPSVMAGEFIHHVVDSRWNAHLMEWTATYIPKPLNEGISEYDSVYGVCERYLTNMDAVSKEKGSDGITKLDWWTPKALQIYIDKVVKVRPEPTEF